MGSLESDLSTFWVEWIAWWTVFTIAARVVMVWLFDHTGHSVFGMALSHMTLNLTWQLFPIQGAYYDYRLTGLMLAVIAAIVVGFWGTQLQGRHHRTSQALI